MIQRLMLVVLLGGGMLVTAKADEVVLGTAQRLDAQTNRYDQGWAPTVAQTSPVGFVQVTAGKVINVTSTFQDFGASYASTVGKDTDHAGAHGADFLRGREPRWEDWGDGKTHFSWGSRIPKGPAGAGTVSPVATPEPSTIVLLGAGVMGLALRKICK